MDSVTTNRVRPLSLEDLNIAPSAEEHDEPRPDPDVEPLDDDDDLLAEVNAAIKMGFAGVILSGPPGTGKSWYAKRLAYKIAGNPDAVRIIKFHTSYQYEDFIEGYAPKNGGGFELQKKTFALICEDAAELPDVTHVLLIDEISRCDVARVFGEALTYVETDKRNMEFTLSSGSPLIVPDNLVILATMNPWDKGVDELDIALERRFAQIDVPPSVEAMRKILGNKKVDQGLIDRLTGFFESVQKIDDEMVHLGHAYFNNCVDEESCWRAWRFRLLPFFTKACRLNKEALNDVKRHWRKAFPEAPAQPPAEDGKTAEGAPATDQPQQQG